MTKLTIASNFKVKTIDKACAIFGAKPKHMGFLRAAGAPIPNEENVHIWCPNALSKTWFNEMKGDIIIEYPKDATKRAAHWKQHLDENVLRVTFIKDSVEKHNYRFVGVFKLDIERTKKENQCVWYRISDTFPLPTE